MGKKNVKAKVSTGTEQETKPAKFASLQGDTHEKKAKLADRMAHHLDSVRQGFLAAEPK